MAEAGRKRGEASREAILNAAEMIFAEHGFDGARVDTIASESGYDKKLIFRYFGDKPGLYAEVLKRIDREAIELTARASAPLLRSEAATSRDQFKVFLETIIQAFFAYMLEHPRFARMLTWEMAEGWQTYRQIASQFSTEDRDQFEIIFRKAYGAGLLRSDFTPVIQFATIMQMCLTYFASLPAYQMLLPEEDISSSKSLARVCKYLVDFIIAGMMSDPAETKSEKGI